MKRLLILILVCTLLPSAALPLRAEETAEFIVNGGFEEILGAGAPTGWSFAGGGYGTNYWLDTQNPGGEASCMAMKSETEYLDVWQKVRGLVGGTDYSFSASVRSVAGRKLQVLIDCIGIDAEGKNYLIEQKEIILQLTIGGGWKTHTETVSLPENTYAANMHFRLRLKNAEVYLDDLSFTGARVDNYVPVIDPETLPVYTDKPMAAGATELIPHGDFETVNPGGTPQSWSSKNQEWDDCVQYTEEYFHGESGHSVKLSTKAADEPFVSYRVLGITPMSEHQVSVYLKSHAIGSEGFGYKLEYLDSEKKLIRTELSERFQYITGEHWVKFAVLFTAPENCDSVRITFRLFTTGTVYLDDASCYQTEAPYYLRLSTDQVFYYSDTDVISASAHANLYTYPALAEEAVTFRLCYNGAAVGEPKTVPLASGTAQCTFPVSDLAVEKTEYTIEATLADNTETASVYRYPRPSALSKDGTYQKDGAPFHPVFAYHVETEDYEKVKEAGINVVQGSCTQKTLDAAYTEELMVLVVLYNNMLCAGHPKNEALTRARVEAYKNHPAVFAWAIMDEPSSNDPGGERHLKNAYKIIREIDDEHPVFVMDVGENKHNVIKYADIFGIDPYVGEENEFTTYVAEKTAESYAVSLGKPVYTLLQAYENGASYPTGDEMRSMLYQAILEKSKAVGYFRISNSKGLTALYGTDLWQVLCDWYKNEAEILFTHFVKNSDAAISQYADQTVRWCVFAGGGSLYAAVLNLSGTAESRAVISIGEDMVISDAEIIGKAAEECTVNYGKEGLSVLLPPSAAVLYKLTLANDTAVYSFSGEMLEVMPAARNVEIVYAGEKADVYVGVYRAEETELCDLAIFQNTEKGRLRVTAPTHGVFKVKAFAFVPGTITPLPLPQ